MLLALDRLAWCCWSSPSGCALPWPLLVYAAAVLVTVWASDGQIHSRVRLLMPAFPLLVPVAVGLARRRTATAVAVVVAAALASAWFGGYTLTIWRYAI